jgi:hypothetical protein
LAAAGAVAVHDRRADAGDLLYFVHRGERLLSVHWASVYADRELQAGPLQLVLAGVARSTEVLAFVVEIGVAALLLLTLGRLGVAARWRLLAGLAAVAVGLVHGAFVEGHPAEVITPLLWVLAATEARRGRGVRAGTLVGVSAGLELWGLLGAAVLFLAPRVREATRGVLVAVVLVALQLAPFVAFGDVRMFEYRWRVSSDTLIGFVLPAGTHFGWPLRLLQAGVACGLGTVLARRLRSVHAVWLVPLTVALARIALDPLAYGWYWLEVESIVLVGATLVFTGRPLRALAVRRRTIAAPPPAARRPTRAHS